MNTRPLSPGQSGRATTDFTFARYFHPLSILLYKRFLDRAETFSRDQLAEHQNTRLRDLLAYAYRHVPYYREVFDARHIRPSDIARAEDLAQLPTLTKDTLRARRDDLLSDEFRRLGPDLTRTSGSTGTPLEFYTDRHIAVAKFALFWRVWGWTGYRLGRRWALIGGAVLEPGALWKHERMMNALYVSSFVMTPASVPAILAKLQQFRPSMLRGYPSALCALARLAANPAALRRIGATAIVTNSETLLEPQRQYLEEVFACPVYDVYSQWESVCVAAECRHRAFHHQMEYSILEMLDNRDQPVADGEMGEITGTSLVNRVMPFIRYKTRDLARRARRACPCGRAHDVIDRIDGRIEDSVVTPEGRHVGRLDAAFKYNRGFDVAQIVQDRVDCITVRLVKNRLFDGQEQAVLEQHLRNRLGDRIRIAFEFVERIEPEPTGKLRFVISRLNA